MRQNRLSHIERERNLATIASLYLAGKSQQEIAEAIGRNRSQVSRGLKTLLGRWQESQLVDFDQAKAIEVAKINHLERIAYEAWERSCSEKTTSVAEKSDGKSKTSLRKEDTAGDPRFLDQVKWCIEQRLKIFGMYAPTKSEHSGPGGGPIRYDFSKWSDEQLEAFVSTGEHPTGGVEGSEGGAGATEA